MRIGHAPWTRASVWITNRQVQPAGGTIAPNTHSYFRLEFELEQPDPAAHLRITAVDCYRAWVNGEYVGEGPAPAAHNSYDSDEYPISGKLRAGKNVLAVEVYYQGLINRVWNSGHNRHGLRVEMVGAQGIIAASNPLWRTTTTSAYIGTRKVGYDTQFLEDVDGRLLPRGWQAVNFDASGWARAIEADASRLPVLVDREIPPLQVTKVAPVSIRQVEPNGCLLDFGEEIVGCLGFAVKANAGHQIEIRHAEELDGQGRARYQMRCNCEYRENYIAAGDADERVQLFDYKAFRYVELLNLLSEPTPESVWVLRRNYPWSDDATRFTCSDPVIAGVWKICANGVRNGCQGGMLDCPSREKGQYLGDALVTSLSHMYLQGDSRLTRKTILDFALSEQATPGLAAVAPGSFHQEIADFSLLWPELLWNYYQFSGDLTLVRELLPVLCGTMEYFMELQNKDGLLENVVGKWNLVDWPENLRDGYDYDRAVNGINTVLNAFYHGALLTSTKLIDALGEKHTLHDAAAKHREAFRRRLLRADSRLFVDAAGSEHSSLHANALPLLYGLAEGEEIPAIIELIRSKGLSCGVYFAQFVLRALIQHGQSDLAFDLMFRPGANSWHTMLASGVTACIEAWHPDQKWNTSLNHPWSSSPIWLLERELIGIWPAQPGFTEILFAPRLPRNFPDCTLQLTLPTGACEVQLQRKGDGAYTAQVQTPTGVPLKVQTARQNVALPPGQHTLTLP
jgi:hypothetical protein